jgi:hypothetical protein
MEMRNVLVNPEWNVRVFLINIVNPFMNSQYKKGHYFVKRPALDYFMDVVGYPNFELVIYTSENMMTVSFLVNFFLIF